MGVIRAAGKERKSHMGLCNMLDCVSPVCGIAPLGPGEITIRRHTGLRGSGRNSFALCDLCLHFLDFLNLSFISVY